MNHATHPRGAARWRRYATSAGALAALCLVAGCGGPFPQSTLDPAADMAANLEELFELILWLAIGVFVLVEGALLVAIFRYRVRPEHLEEGHIDEPRFLHGNTVLEIIWTLAPAVVLVFIAVPTMTTIWEVDRPTTDAEALQVDVIGHQWWWEFRYPDLDIVTANELHLPVGRTVNFRLSSADVIHSFWFPRQGGKRDVIPGRENNLWFQPDSVGRFPGQCAEFCGLSHALMKMEVVVHPPEEFAEWVEGQQQPAAILENLESPEPGVAAGADAEGPAETADADAEGTADADAEAPADAAGADAEGAAQQDGETPAESGDAAPAAQEVPDDVAIATLAREGHALFMQKGCMACHRIQGTPAQGVIGPDLSHFGSRHMLAAGILENNRENLIRWMRNPEAVKPGAKMPNLQLTDEELELLADYLKSLR